MTKLPEFQAQGLSGQTITDQTVVAMAPVLIILTRGLA